MKHELKKVKPKNTLLFGSAPCEEQCAHIRNNAVAAIEEEDIKKVSHLYLQSREGQHTACARAIFGSIFLPLFFQVPPSLGNMGRYKKTKRGCKEWLNNRLDKELFGEIQQLNYNSGSRAEIETILRKSGRR